MTQVDFHRSNTAKVFADRRGIVMDDLAEACGSHDPRGAIPHNEPNSCRGSRRHSARAGRGKRPCALPLCGPFRSIDGYQRMAYDSTELNERCRTTSDPRREFFISSLLAARRR
jgi:hypothetical protein